MFSERYCLFSSLVCPETSPDPHVFYQFCRTGSREKHWLGKTSKILFPDLIAFLKISTRNLLNEGVGKTRRLMNKFEQCFQQGIDLHPIATRCVFTTLPKTSDWAFCEKIDGAVFISYSHEQLHRRYFPGSLIRFRLPNVKDHCSENKRRIIKTNQKYSKILVLLSWSTNVNPLSDNLRKWSNTLKKFVGKLSTNCLSVFEHFAGLEC